MSAQRWAHARRSASTHQAGISASAIPDIDLLWESKFLKKLEKVVGMGTGFCFPEKTKGRGVAIGHSKLPIAD